jgi:hypothetical protein
MAHLEPHANRFPDPVDHCIPRTGQASARPLSPKLEALVVIAAHSYPTTTTTTTNLP